MLLSLTPDKKGLRKLYNIFGGKKELKVPYCEFWDKYFSPVDDFGPGYYLNNDPGTPCVVPMYAYKEFTREILFEDEDCAIGGKKPYGIADNKEQIEEYFKDEIADPEKKFVIMLSRIDYAPCKKELDECIKNNRQYQGYRPRKSGIYLGDYQQIKDCEYYAECEFPEDYQGYLIKFILRKAV